MKFDQFWEKFSLQQRKEIVRDTTAQQQLFISMTNRFTLELISIILESIETWIPKLENPKEDVKLKYNPEERKNLLMNLYKNRNEVKKTQSDIFHDSQPLSKQEIKEFLT